MKKDFLYSLLLHFLISALCVHAKSSGCEMCASTGNCYAAYKNSPGQFCGYFHDYGFETKPCCCPINSYCKMSSFECLCHVPDRPYVPDIPPHGPNGPRHNSNLKADLIFIMVLIFCSCICYMCFKISSWGMSEQESGYIPVAVPATIDANPPATAPSYDANPPATAPPYESDPYSK
jgi:hypothetical protein